MLCLIIFTEQVPLALPEPSSLQKFPGAREAVAGPSTLNLLIHPRCKFLVSNRLKSILKTLVTMNLNTKLHKEN